MPEFLQNDARDAIRLFQDRYGPLPQRASLDDLCELLWHFSHLPYENLSKILAWQGGELPPRLRGPAVVMAEHLELGTGGTCFSLTELLRHLVRAAGFACQPVMAHMRHGPNIHCALKVLVGARAYVVDPGYLVRQPLPLDRTMPPGLPRPGQARLVVAGSVGMVPANIPAGDFDLFTLEAEGLRWRYRIVDQEVSPAAFLRHWEASFFQPSMHALLASRRSEEGEFHFLHNHKLRRLTIESKSTTNIRRMLEDSVQQIFGIDPRVTRQAADLLARRRAQDEPPSMMRRGPQGLWIRR
jgi:arylamine N-acetyltransferase